MGLIISVARLARGTGCLGLDEATNRSQLARGVGNRRCVVDVGRRWRQRLTESVAHDEHAAMYRRLVVGAGLGSEEGPPREDTGALCRIEHDPRY